jgi:hypothetical protein
MEVYVGFRPTLENIFVVLNVIMVIYANPKMYTY